MNDSKVVVRDMINNKALHRPRNPDRGSPSDGISSNAEGSEMEKSETTRRRIAGKKAVECCRLECTDLGLHFRGD